MPTASPKKILALIIVSLSAALFSDANAAKFNDFTLYNEVGFGGGAGSITASRGTQSTFVGYGDYRFGIREKYFYLTTIIRGAYTQLDSETEEGSTAFKYGFGFGIEMDLPIRLYLGSLLGGSGGIYKGTTYESGFLVELGYYLSETTLISLSIESENLENGDSIDLASVQLTFPFDINYPKIPWRKKRPTDD